MSRTMVKNGSEVQRAIHHLSAGQGILGSNRLCLVSEVAREAGCCKGTALKYLKILQEHGIVQSIAPIGSARLFCWGGS